MLDVSGVLICVFYDCHKNRSVMLLCFAIVEQLSVNIPNVTKKEEKNPSDNRGVFFIII